MNYTIATESDGTVVVYLEGAINEDAELDLQKLREELSSATKAAFHFAKVKSINSLGVRAWVSFLRAVDSKLTTIFRECTSDVIMQLNMIPSFQGKASIESFYTHYICDSCGHRETSLIQCHTVNREALPSTLPCPKCSETMETEELEDEYFIFLKR